VYSSKAKAVRSRVPIGQCFSRESSRLDLRWQEAASQNTDWRSRGAARIDYREILTQTAHANNDRTSESTRVIACKPDLQCVTRLSRHMSV
jgi:hypothetical protein